MNIVIKVNKMITEIFCIQIFIGVLLAIMAPVPNKHDNIIIKIGYKNFLVCDIVLKCSFIKQIFPK